MAKKDWTLDVSVLDTWSPMDELHGWRWLSRLQTSPRLVRSLHGLRGLTLVLFSLEVHGQTIPYSLPEGIWRTQGYGFVFNVQKDQIAEFDVLGSQCIATGVRTPIQFSADFGDFEVIPAAKTETWRLKTSGMEVTRLDRLPESCATPLAHDARPLVNFDYFWSTFHHSFSFFCGAWSGLECGSERVAPESGGAPG